MANMYTQTFLLTATTVNLLLLKWESAMSFPTVAVELPFASKVLVVQSTQSSLVLLVVWTSSTLSLVKVCITFLANTT